MMGDPEAFALQLFREQQRQAVIILHNHHTWLLLLVCAPLGHFLHRPAVFHKLYGETEPYGSTFTLHRINANGPLVFFNNFLADGETEPGSANPLGGAVVHSSEFLEQLANLILGDSQPLILNPYQNPVWLIVEHHLDFMASR
ncbi:hypothetical protein D3C75_909170 [compost metagenome]